MQVQPSEKDIELHGAKTLSDCISRYSLQIQPEVPAVLDGLPATVIRGAMGFKLRDRLCKCQRSNAHTENCRFSVIFDGDARHSQMLVPRFVISLSKGPIMLSDHVPVVVEISLLGLARSEEEQVLAALSAALNDGLGAKRAPFKILSRQKAVLSSLDLTSGFNVYLTTPWFVKRHGNVVESAQFTFHDVLIGLASRQRHLARALGCTVEIPSNRDILAFADKCVVDSDLLDRHWTRRSSRQKQSHPLKGVEGALNICVGGSLPSWLDPLLGLGEWVHGGGKTAFGLGAIRVTPQKNEIQKTYRINKESFQ